MSLPKRFIEGASALALKMADNVKCGECGGSGCANAKGFNLHHCDVCYKKDISCGEGFHPCPSCSPERTRLRALAKRLCWHEIVNGVCTCGEKPTDYEIVTCQHTFLSNPTFDNPVDIVAVMVELGVWERFVAYLWEKYKVYYPPTIAHKHLQCKGVEAVKVANILTTPQLQLPEAIAFMREELESQMT